MGSNALRVCEEAGRGITSRRGALVLLFVWAVLPLHAGEDVQIQADVVYGHKDGMALTFDVLEPAKPSGAGVLFIWSAGWYSVWMDPKALLPACQPLLDKGMTVFLVRHGSAPKYVIPEIVEDVRRSVRFIRLHANEWGVDPDRLGALGASAGGHLALMLATTGDDGDPKAADEVLRQSNRVAAAAAMFPPTDIRDWVTDPPEAIRRIALLKPPRTFDPAKAGDCSPVLHVTARTAPTLLIHGDKDELVPLDHSRNMIAALEKEHVACDLVVMEGAAHGFDAGQNHAAARAIVDWFEKHLAQPQGR